jgi:integrase
VALGPCSGTNFREHLLAKNFGELGAAILSANPAEALRAHRKHQLEERVGLSGLTFHSLRHTCATLLLSKNVNPKIFQEMLGHATISQTMDTYSHVMPSMSDVAAEAIESALS